MREPVFYAVPMTHAVFSRWVYGFFKFITTSWREGDQLGYRPPTIVHIARQDLVEQFLKTDCQWLFWIDDDVVPPPHALWQMLSHGEKVVNGLVPFKEPPYNPNWYLDPIYDKSRDTWTYEGFFNPPSDKLVEIASAGLACSLIHREVIEKMEYPYFTLDAAAEDHSFWRKVKDAGYQLYGDPSVQCIHMGIDGVSAGHWLAYQEMYKQNPFSVNGSQLVKDYNESTGQDHTLAVRSYEAEHYKEDESHLFYLTRDQGMEFADSISSLAQVDEKLVLIIGDALGTVAQGMRDSNDIILLRDKVVDPIFAEEQAALSGTKLKTITKLKGEFDIIVALDEFARLENDQLDSEIRKISNALKPGGVLYFNVHNKSHHAPNWNEHPDLPNRLKAQGLEMTHFGGSELSIAMRKP
jgi:hypothetical protein